MNYLLIGVRGLYGLDNCSRALLEIAAAQAVEAVAQYGLLTSLSADPSLLCTVSTIYVMLISCAYERTYILRLLLAGHAKARVCRS